jgi:hypothetical protein
VAAAVVAHASLFTSALGQSGKHAVLLDSAATSHAVNAADAFTHMHQGNPETMEGIDGLEPVVMGKGTDRLFDRSGRMITLHDAPYVPTAAVIIVSAGSANMVPR